MRTVDELLAQLEDYFSEMNDDEDAPFGTYARVSRDGSAIIVRHETEDHGVRVTVEPLP